MEKLTEKVLDNIRKKRKEKGVSVLNLAEDVGISRSHLYYIESKKVVPSIDVVVKIAKVLKVNVKEFFD
ncbi:helix-turn-helix domain-containing protein [Breznakiella homolactica]|uniref:Helix-turn-helix transcriptional regulator n=1 Tax=Breznakiella homolactica TaxID=2798577 RepID=A0A7T7XKD6_9SPIR|nr:helix-turn-helix transcriptional regulator [Breznakiella homolactica]QQO07872.1 helix-turn-helix domain-containing protein [Breznakiella homolactica]